MNLSFCSLSSGSSGNCYYVGNEFHGILIDAGISATSIRKFLKGIGVSMQTVMGVLVTHNHIDHIRGLEVLARKNNVPIFTTRNIWRSILNPQCSITRDCIREIPMQEEFNLSGFSVEAFPVCHDAPETVGYHICFEGRRITIVTDLGHICQTSAPYIRKSNLLVIESNYDEEMLVNGKYPYYLRKRIQSDNGHLGNKQTSDFVSGIINDDLRYICLAHLSKNNNTPEIALETISRTLLEKGIILSATHSISVLKRNVPSELIVF